MSEMGAEFPNGSIAYKVQMLPDGNLGFQFILEHWQIWNQFQMVKGRGWNIPQPPNPPQPLDGKEPLRGNEVYHGWPVVGGLGDDAPTSNDK